MKRATHVLADSQATKDDLVATVVGDQLGRQASEFSELPGGLGMLAIPSMADRWWLFVPMVGVDADGAPLYA